MNRHYMKCNDCLTVAVILSEHNHPGTHACGVCGGNAYHMGRVYAETRLVQTYHACPCNEKCTCASGPSCDCRCGGENHGTGLIVEVTRDCGPVPVMRMKPDENAKVRGEWYRNELSAIAEAIKTHYEKDADTNKNYRARKQLAEAKASKGWKKRDRCIAAAWEWLGFPSRPPFNATPATLTHCQ